MISQCGIFYFLPEDFIVRSMFLYYTYYPQCHFYFPISATEKVCLTVNGFQGFLEVCNLNKCLLFVTFLKDISMSRLMTGSRNHSETFNMAFLDLEEIKPKMLQSYVFNVTSILLLKGWGDGYVVLV